MFTSPILLADFRGVLALEHRASRLAQQRSSVGQAIGFYGELALSVSPLTAPRVVPTDADDDHVIAAAFAAQVDLLVSGDRDLLSMGRHEGLSIVTAAQAVALIDNARSKA